jgi:hypothetical protein
VRTVASIRTISHRSVFTPALLESEHNGAIVACDFYVDGSEHGREVPGGYEIGSILNVDHHAPSERMARQISSTNLAIDHVRRFGPAKPDTLVVISHTDCDSVLSSCIMAGELEPERNSARLLSRQIIPAHPMELPTCCNRSMNSVTCISRFATCASFSTCSRWIESRSRITRSA